MGGFGKAKAGSGSKTLERVAGEQWDIAKPVQSEVGAQMLRALQTGGVGAQLPLAQKSVEGSMAAMSQALTGLDERLAMSPALAASPWAALSRGRTLQSGYLATSQIPIQIAQGFVSAAPSWGNTAANISFAGSGTAGGQQTEANIETARFQQELMKQLFQVGSAAGGAMAMGCWIAAAVYGGWDDPRTHAARAWLFGGWDGPVADAVRWAYLRVGKRVGAWLTRHAWAQAPVRWLLDRAVVRGRLWLEARGLD